MVRMVLHHIQHLSFGDLEVDIETIGQPDGYNINDNCGSTHPELLVKRFLKLKATLV